MFIIYFLLFLLVNSLSYYKGNVISRNGTWTGTLMYKNYTNDFCITDVYGCIKNPSLNVYPTHNEIFGIKLFYTYEIIFEYYLVLRSEGKVCYYDMRWQDTPTRYVQFKIDTFQTNAWCDGKVSNNTAEFIVE